MKPMHPRRRLAKIIRDPEQAIRDASYWNSINPTEQPMDIEPERVMLSIAKRSAKLWDNDQIPEAQAVMDMMIEYAETEFTKPL